MSYKYIVIINTQNNKNKIKYFLINNINKPVIKYTIFNDIEKNNKIDISGIEVVKGGKTFFWEGLYHVNMNHRDTITTELNVLADFNPIVPNNYKNAEIVLLGNLHPAIQLSVLEQMNSKPKLVILDTMNYWMDNTLDKLINVISKVDLLCINDQEAEQLTGENDLKIAAQKISELGPKFLIIKKGEFGSFDSKTATALSLIITELIHNALEHGLTHSGNSLMVEIARDRNKYVVSVCDDGPGFPEGFSIEKSANLGLQIVNTLTKNELNGNLILNRIDNLTKAEIVFGIN